MSVIAPESINIAELPSLALADRRLLPNGPACYLGITKAIADVAVLGQVPDQYRLVSRDRHWEPSKTSQKYVTTLLLV